MTKTHFRTWDPAVACGRAARRATTNVFEVSCLACKATSEFVTAELAAEAASKAAFDAQEPRTFAEPWSYGNIECHACGGDTFRYRGRSCHGHYDDYVCAACGYTASRLTETGMSF